MHSYMIAINQVQKFNPIIPLSFIPLSSSSFHLHFILFFSPFSPYFPFHLFSLILSLIYFLPLPSSSFLYLIFVFSLISSFFLISLSFSNSSPFSFSPPFLSLSTSSSIPPISLPTSYFTSTFLLPPLIFSPPLSYLLFFSPSLFSPLFSSSIFPSIFSPPSSFLFSPSSIYIFSHSLFPSLFFTSLSSSLL